MRSIPGEKSDELVHGRYVPNWSELANPGKFHIQQWEYFMLEDSILLMCMVSVGTLIPNTSIDYEYMNLLCKPFKGKHNSRCKVTTVKHLDF